MSPRKAAVSATDRIKEIAPEEITKTIDLEKNDNMDVLRRLFSGKSEVECPTEVTIMPQYGMIILFDRVVH